MRAACKLQVRLHELCSERSAAARFRAPFKRRNLLTPCVASAARGALYSLFNGSSQAATSMRRCSRSRHRDLDADRAWCGANAKANTSKPVVPAGPPIPDGTSVFPTWAGQLPLLPAGPITPYWMPSFPAADAQLPQLAAGPTIPNGIAVFTTAPGLPQVTAGPQQTNGIATFPLPSFPLPIVPAGPVIPNGTPVFPDGP